MNKSNFALISALYSKPNAGLYTDIYFPIIKYSIVSFFYLDSQKQYYTSEYVRNYIIDRFGIQIPTIVLKNAIKRLAKIDKSIELQIYDGGNEFKIEKAWDASVNIDIDKREHYFNEYLERLEALFKLYIDTEKINSEDVTFVGFITDNAEDILGYFENNDIERVTAKYANMASFLQHLRSADGEMFKIANELFWGSIIAGFLKSEKPSVLKDDNGIATEYYLDTAVIMGILNLSTEEREIYTKELIEIISAAGGVLRVHPITIEEVKRIIKSVEYSGNPINTSDISSAWERYGLNPAKLAGIRTNIDKLLNSKQIQIFPNISPADLLKNINEYKGKKEVKTLTLVRTNYEFLPADDIFRDVHDIFMDDYIFNRRKIKQDDEHCFFVTMNSDLVLFSKDRHQGKSCMINTGKVVLELWMHNTSKSSIADSALTEAIARCMDLNNKDVHKKLEIVSKYYNENTHDFDPKVFKCIIQELYRRANNVITAVDDLEDCDNPKLIQNKLTILKEAAIKNTQSYSKQIISINNFNNELNTKVDVLSKDIEQLKTINLDLENKKSDLENRNKELEEINKFSTDKTLQLESINSDKEAIIKLYCRKDEINIKLQDIYKEKSQLESSLDSIYSYKSLYILYFIFVFCIAICIFIIYYSCITGKYGLLTICGAILAFTGLFFVPRKMYSLSEAKKRIKDLQYEKWADKEKYEESLKKIDLYEEELRQINNELKERLGYNTI